MAEFVKIAETADISSGSMKSFRVGTKTIAVANVDGKFFAIDDTCSHAQCSLGSEGFLDGSTVTCGCHGAQFDVATGSVVSLPATEDVVSYQVKEENGEIFVNI